MLWRRRLNFQWLSQMKQNKLTANKLEQKHKHEVIQMLATFQKPKDIVEYLKARYDISVTERNIYFYLENRVDDIETERDRIRRDLRAIPIANLFYRLKERQALIDDLKEHLWIEVYLNRDGRAITGEDGNPKLLKKQGNHSVINQLLDSVAKELGPLESEEIAKDKDGQQLSPEEVTRRLVWMLDSWLMEKARELGETEPSVEERAKLVVQFIDLKKNSRLTSVAKNYENP